MQNSAQSMHTVMVWYINFQTHDILETLLFNFGLSILFTFFLKMTRHYKSVIWVTRSLDKEIYTTNLFHPHWFWQYVSSESHVL